MGMNLINLGIGLSAHRRIANTASTMRSIDQRLDEGELSAESLRRDVEKLYLIVEALWAIVRKATNLTDEDLQKLVREIDLQDGKRDGRNAGNTAVARCARCGKTLLKGQAACAYCGEKMAGGGTFRHAGQ